MRRTSYVAVALALLAPFFPVRAEGPAFYSVEVSHAGPTALRSLKVDAGVAWWVELGDLLVVSGTSATRDRAAASFAVEPIDGPTGDETLYVGHRAHGDALDGARVLAKSGVFALVAATPEAAEAIDAAEPGQIAPLTRNFVYARSSINEVEPARPLAKAGEAYAAAVDVARWRRTTADLVAFETRYTGTQGALGARDYIASQFLEIGLPTFVADFPVGSLTGYNVVAEVRGTSRPSDVYIVCGHYDSISEQRETLAPGAEDNASGAAGVIELARVFAANPPEATVRFICFSGEEEGLFGSRKYVDELISSETLDSVKAVVTMDMIAYSGDGDLDVLLETGAVGRELSDTLAAAAAASATNLRVVKSFNPFGSDHVPFIEAGVPCVLTIENDWDSYSAYHTSRDTMENVRADMGGGVLKMNAAALGALAGEPGEVGGGDLSVVVPFARNTHVAYGGFVQEIAWTAEEDAFELFIVDYTLDGENYTPIALGLDGSARSFKWIVPEEARSNQARVRIFGHPVGGGTPTIATSETFKVRPGDGPFIRSIKFKTRTNYNFVVNGRFSADGAIILVDGVAVGSSIVDSKDVKGNVTKRVYGQVASLDAVFPAGVPVSVAVQDTAGRTTAAFTVTR